MKKNLLALLILITLTACGGAPAVSPTETPTAFHTATPLNTGIPSSETPIPTETQPAPTVKFDSATRSAMDEVARQAEYDKLPATITFEGMEYTKGGFSTVKDNLVKFYGPDGKLMAHDFFTGENMTDEQAGIIEFDLTDGTKWGVEAFATGQEAIDYAYYVDGARTAQRETIALPGVYAYFDSYIEKVPGYKNERTWAPIINPANPSVAAFGTFACSYGSGSLLTYYGSDKQFHTKYVHEDPKIFIPKVRFGEMFLSKQ